LTALIYAWAVADAFAYGLLVIDPTSAALNTEDLRIELVSTGRFSAVDVWDSSLATPTLQQLQQYDGVLLSAGGAWHLDGAALGTALLDFTLAGGTLVETQYTGYFLTMGETLGPLAPYLPIAGSANGMGWGPAGPTFVDPLTPLAAGTRNLQIPTEIDDMAVRNPGAHLVAVNSASGAPLIATREVGNGKIVSIEINFIGGTDAGYGIFYAINDSAIMVANAFTPDPNAFELTITGSCPGHITATVLNGTPNRNMEFYTSPDPGRYYVLGGCRVLMEEILLDQPILVGTARFDARGRYSITQPVSARRCGHYVGVFDVRGCQVAHAQIPLPP
jgi:hypothetical protein